MGLRVRVRAKVPFMRPLSAWLLVLPCSVGAHVLCFHAKVNRKLCGSGVQPARM